MNFESQMEIQHQKRLKSDPIYRIFMEPFSLVDDNEVFIDTILSLSIEFVYKKYGQQFVLKDCTLEKVYKLLLSSEQALQQDVEIKTFALIFIIHYEPELRAELVKMYDDTEPVNEVWGGSDHFTSWIFRMEQNIDMTLRFPYDVNNIQTVVRNFVTAAKMEYFMGPTSR